MGVDYTPIAGFSVKLTKQDVTRLEKDVAPEGWQDDYGTVFDALDLEYSEIGSSYSGDTDFIPLFVPENVINLDAQIKEWLDDLNKKLQTSFEIEDVEFVTELRIW